MCVIRQMIVDFEQRGKKNVSLVASSHSLCQSVSNALDVGFIFPCFVSFSQLFV